MKKLILSLSVITISVSSVTSALSFTKLSDENANTIDEMSLLAEQYAKIYYLNQEKNYNVNYVYNNNVKDFYISDISQVYNSSLPNLKDWTRFSSVSNKYLDAKDDQWKGAENLTTGLTPKINFDLSGFNSIIQNLGSFIQDDNFMGLMLFLLHEGLSLKPEIITNLDFLQYGKVILSDENLDALASAFDMSKYQDMTLKESLNESIISFAKGLNTITGGAESNNNNIEMSLKSIENSIIKIKSNKIDSFNLITNFSAICDILNFMHVSAFYLNSFITQEISKETSVLLEWNDLEEFRNKKVKEFDNKFDIKNLLKYLDKAINVEDKEGIKIRNLLNVIFWENNDFKTIGSIFQIPNFFKSLTENDYTNSWGISGVFKAIGNAVSDDKIAIGNMLVTSIALVSSDAKIVSGDLVNSIIDLAGPLLGNFIKDEKMKNLITALLNSNFLETPWEVLWSGNVLKEILQVDNLYMLTQQIKEKLSPIITPLDIDNESVVFSIDWDTLSKMILELKGVISILENDPKMISQKLGGKIPIAEDSFIYYLRNLEKDLHVGSNLVPLITKYLDDKNQIEKELDKNIKNDFQNLKLKTKVDINNNQTLVSIDNKKIDVSFEKKDKSKKYIINKISYVN
ncbi:hypothetical protein [Mesoplasma corruscae]|uniref:MOLPALP family lipoprotein n=1 Tax=Mesoplasma corruscae TaxID=216874 RepID=A0A2S5RGB7_9MOLU|nr:hypothetical protein [Mesoplasma corruscae]PPE06341.1 hypothetical protein MCORR_v1c06460 [Mesoplasma corruscae]